MGILVIFLLVIITVLIVILYIKLTQINNKTYSRVVIQLFIFLFY